VGLAAEVLPVVGIHAQSFVVLGVVGAPLGLKVEHVEFLISCHFVDEGSLDVLVGVSETAELFVFALLGGLGTELRLVLFDMVQALDFVVCEFALFISAALLGAEVKTVLDQGGAATPV